MRDSGSERVLVSKLNQIYRFRMKVGKNLNEQVFLRKASLWQNWFELQIVNYVVC